MREIAMRHGADPRHLVGEHYMRAVSRFYLGDDAETACQRAYEHIASNLACRVAEAA